MARADHIKTVFDPEMLDSDRVLAERMLGEVDGDPKETKADENVNLMPFALAGSTLIGVGAWGYSTTFMAGGAILALVGGSFMIRDKILDRADTKKKLSEEDRWAQIANQVVVDGEFTSELARDLMARTQEAIDTIQSSAAHRRDPDLKAQADTALPAHEWDIAYSLREHDSLLERWQEDYDQVNGSDHKLTPALIVQQNVLANVIDSMTKRVESLEKYAKQVKFTDQQLVILERDEAAAARMDEYLDLAARVARDGQAVAEVEAMTDQVNEMRRKVMDLMLPLHDEAQTVLSLPA